MRLLLAFLSHPSPENRKAFSLKDHSFALGFCLLCLLYILCAPLSAQGKAREKKKEKKISLRIAARGFKKPLQIAFSPGDPLAMYVVEQGGRIYRIVHKKAQLFADLSRSINSSSGEEGLLGLAFPPDYKPENSHCYVNYTAKEPAYTYIAELDVKNKRVQIGAQRTLLRFKQPYRNHNGGFLTFGPDQKLYIATGDGGAAGDPLNAGQDLTSLLGKILRIDVRPTKDKPYRIPPDNPFVGKAKTRAEIYAWGLRNPWRFSFDSKTKRLYAADVGQNLWEEINLIVKGANYGWRRKEGKACYRPRRNCSSKKFKLTDPIYSYDHSKGQSIIGGYVYRGKKLKALQAHYFFADYLSGALWALPLDPKSGGAQAKPLLLKKKKKTHISSFGEDLKGELYISEHQKGLIYKLVPP